MFLRKFPATFEIGGMHQKQCVQRNIFYHCLSQDEEDGITTSDDESLVYPPPSGNVQEILESTSEEGQTMAARTEEEDGAPESDPSQAKRIPDIQESTSEEG